MAADLASGNVNVNGNGTHAAHTGNDASQNGYNTATSSYNSAPASQNASSTTPDIPKDEVGWYFVEQYYATLSSNPDKLYLFYNKRSQFVFGDEADKVNVSVGQKAINERIKELDINDCKLRVTNVDSQASDANIVIQVIGEISNKSRPHRKFVQTFILAGQTNGYFVLNDIFRYLVDEEEEAATGVETVPAQITETDAVNSSAPPATSTETLATSSDPAETEASAKLVDQEIQAKIATPADTPAVNGTHEQDAVEPSKPSEAQADAPVASPVAPAALEAEKPKDPVPTPALSPAEKSAEPVPTATQTAPPQASSNAPAKPAAAKTWANLAAAAHKVPIPAVPSQTPAAASPAQSKPAATAQAPAPTATPAANSTQTAAPSSSAVEAAQEITTEETSQDEWTSVGDHRKQQSRAQNTSTAQEGPQTKAYIKNVQEHTDLKALKSLLEKCGELVFFDVNRAKNCAFAEYKTPEAYQAALAGSPYQVGSDRIIVEERRIRAPAGAYPQRGGARGGRGGPNGQGPSRGTFQGGRGGNYAGRGRGGAARGRGGPAAA